MTIETVSVPADGRVTRSMIEAAFKAAEAARKRAARDGKLSKQAQFILTFMTAYDAIVRAAKGINWDVLGEPLFSTAPQEPVGAAGAGHVPTDAGTQAPIAGSIAFEFADPQSKKTISIGGVSFHSAADLHEAWSSIRAFTGATTFYAVCGDGSDVVVARKPVSAEDCEALMGAPIAALIDAGRDGSRAAFDRALLLRSAHTGRGCA